MNTTILIADDDPDDIALLASDLRRCGYKVLTCSDGREALDAARAYRPAVILLDVMMPGMDGTEVAMTLKSDPDLKSVPIVFLTVLKRHVENCGLAAAELDYVLPKPESPEEFASLRALVAMLALRRTRQAA